MTRDNRLIRLGDTDDVIVGDDDDIRGRPMFDRNGEKLGTIDDLLIDPDDRTVRFLVVGSGGFLGIGENKSFIPVDAISRVTADEVHIDQAREHVAGAPVYDPDIVDGPEPRDYYTRVYGYYGFSPYWLPGYTYPSYRVY